MQKLQLEILTPTGAIAAVEADSVQARSTEGYFEILPQHTTFLASLTIGHIQYREGTDTHVLATSGGVLEVRNNRVVILAETAEPADTIDLERAKAAQERAEERLAQAEDMDFDRARLALAKAINRLHIAQ